MTEPNKTAVDNKEEQVKTYPATRINEDTGQKVTTQLVTKKIRKSKGGTYTGAPYVTFRDIKEMKDLQEAVDFMGFDCVAKWVNDKFNQLGIAAMYEAATFAPEKTPGKDDGDIITVDWQKAIRSIEEGTVAGETLDVLEERKDELGEELIALVDVFGDKDQAKVAKAFVRASAIKKEIHLISEQIAARQAAYAARRAGKKGEAAKVPAVVTTT